MARKVDRTKKPGAPKSGVPDDLDVLHPERSTVIAGREIMVREYGFIEGARLAPKIKPLTDDLHVLIADADVPPGFDAISEVLASHIEVVLELIAIAANVEPEWVTGLNDQDGDFLALLWWQANASFFIRRVLRKAAQEKVARSLAGAGFTQPSSALDTGEARPISDDSPSGS
ncbi:MAG: DUF6631 family protein [Stenotrophomonas sp.]|uniref:DUF6631 family protein n=1 Tax=Stenotrophomonas sp. TaxID=69392 RepID=UPI003D6D46B8